MSSEETELTFIRCPSCRSLVPAVATRCRMCGHYFEGESSEAAEPGDMLRRRSRVRQRTISVSKDEVEEFGHQQEEAGVEGAGQRGAEPAWGSDLEESFAPPPRWPQPEASSEPEMSGESAERDEPQTSSGYAHPEEDLDESPFGGFSPPASTDAPEGRFEEQNPAAAANENAAGQETTGEAPKPRKEPLSWASPRAPLRWAADQQAPAAPDAEEAAAESEDYEEEDFLADEDDEGEDIAGPAPAEEPRHPGKKRRRRRKKRRHGAGDEGQALSPQFPADAAPFPPPEPAPEPEPMEQSAESVRDVPPEPKREFHSDFQRPAQPASARPAEAPAVTELRREGNMASQESGLQESSFARVGEAKPHAGAGFDENAGTGRDEGVLLGWLVSFEQDSKGIAAEIRGGRFFLGKQRLRKSDMVIPDSSISTPHCLVAASRSDGLKIQDLMSEQGTFIKRKGKDSFVQVRDAVVVEHGDYIRFGAYEVLVCLVPGAGRK